MIQFNHVHLSYDKRNVLYDVSFEIQKGEFVYLIGASGSGKSSILKLIYLDEFPDDGFVTISEFDSMHIKKRQVALLRRKVGIVFQDFKLLADRTVYENIEFVLMVTGTRPNLIPRKIEKVLQEVGLEQKSSRYPFELSGGEQQRISIARAIVNDPYILLADEPTGNLDPKVSTDIFELLLKINRRGTAILMATHNYDFLNKYPHRVIEINQGKIVG